ncbi:MAG: ATP-grasp domain-containing protein [Planctomycetales bacterium]|nr:ATP-grasp domain-containing protein [Planctomycetales bacterium]
MRVFLYELITAGGLAAETESLSESLLAEGRAMIEAAAADFAALPGIEVDVLREARIPVTFPQSVITHRIESAAEHEAVFSDLAARADWTLLIAPETGGLLEQRARTVLACGGQLLGPDPATIAICADKQRTAEHLAAAGVPVPFGVRIEACEDLPADFPYPAVVKPIDGCGSQGIYRIDTFAERPPPVPYARRLEQQQPAVANATHSEQMTQRMLPRPAQQLGEVCYPSSVAVLAGPECRIPLPACSQYLSRDGRYQYQGGWGPLPEIKLREAEELALRAVAAFPAAVGFLGVDLVLGASRGRGKVIEVNPRFTTSYVGLRKIIDENIAGLLLDIVGNSQPTRPRARRRAIFAAHGGVRVDTLD